MIPSRPGDGRGKRATVPSVRERAGPQQHLSSGCKQAEFCYVCIVRMHLSIPRNMLCIILCTLSYIILCVHDILATSVLARVVCIRLAYIYIYSTSIHTTRRVHTHHTTLCIVLKYSTSTPTVVCII